jgi:DNA-binding response OmpR family regulator
MLKIMLVEDDRTMLSLLSTLLQMEGFLVVQAKEGSLESVTALMKNENPSLVLIDVNLNQFNGFDLLHEIRRDPSLKNTCVVMSSGMDYTARCLEEGADDFILKPYMPDDLIYMIRNTLKIVRN